MNLIHVITSYLILLKLCIGVESLLTDNPELVWRARRFGWNWNGKKEPTAAQPLSRVRFTVAQLPSAVSRVAIPPRQAVTLLPSQVEWSSQAQFVLEHSIITCNVFITTAGTTPLNIALRSTLQNNWVTPWSRVLGKLTVTQLVNKFPVFYVTLRFITVFTTARHWSLSWARCIQSTPSHPISLRSSL
jgi:hypothetical protein